MRTTARRTGRRSGTLRSIPESSGTEGSNEVITEDYNGLTLSIVDNNDGGGSYDKISADGVYWRGAPSEGETTRYIAYTPDEKRNTLCKGPQSLKRKMGHMGFSLTFISLTTAQSAFGRQTVIGVARCLIHICKKQISVGDARQLHCAGERRRNGSDG